MIIYLIMGQIFGVMTDGTKAIVAIIGKVMIDRHEGDEREEHEGGHGGAGGRR